MSSHKLTRLSKSILEQPQLITAAKFEEIADILEDRDHSLYRAADKANLLANDDGNAGIGLVGERIGVLNVEGPTTYKATGWEALCGGVSYQGLLAQMDELVKLEDVNIILMNINSPGGEAFRMFETARQLRKKADDNGKTLIAYVDGIAASAGFGLAVAAHEIIVNPDSEVGSIGVVIRLLNNTKRMEKEGINVTYITAGASKIPFDDEGEFRKEFLEDLQERVTELYDTFIDHVVTFRDIDPQVVRDTEAKMFSADKALELGLIDKIMEGEALNEHLATISASKHRDDEEDKKKRKPIVTKIVPKGTSETKEDTPKNKELSMSDKEQPQAPDANAELLVKMEAMSKQLATFEAKELAAEKEKLSTQLDSTPFVAACKEDLVSFFMNADVAEESKTLMNTVIDSATKLNKEIVEEAATKVTTAEAAVEEANASKEAIKAEFGKQESIDDKPKEQMNGGDFLTAKIEAQKKEALAAK